jgi:O-antigen ligase
MKRPDQPWLIIMFIGAHAVLGLAARGVPAIAVVHQLVVLAYMLYLAVRGRDLGRSAALAAYIVGSEVFWRMTKGAIFWEGAKYMIAALLLANSLRLRGRTNRVALLYFALLVPSCIITLLSQDVEQARSQLSFYMSGPLELAVCVGFFGHVVMSSEDLRRITIAAVAPMTAVLAISYVASETVSQFGDVSNLATSGGYGPNQVSAVLGLGAFLCVRQLLDSESSSLRLRVAFIVLLCGFGVQSALTFSRGGLYGAGAATVVYLLGVSGQRGQRVRVIGAVLMLALVAEGVLYPWLQARTQGAITQRFSDTGTTGRDVMVVGELQAFFDAPLFGLGPGGGIDVRFEGRSIAAHTEFTRMLAEHGIFGAAALIALISLAIGRIREARRGVERATASAMIVWAAVFMVHAAMRLSAPGFIFGLAFAGLRPARAAAPEVAPMPAIADAVA